MGRKIGGGSTKDWRGRPGTGRGREEQGAERDRMRRETRAWEGLGRVGSGNGEGWEREQGRPGAGTGKAGSGNREGRERGGNGVWFYIVVI